MTSPERTIVDLARAGVPTSSLEAAIDSAIRLRLTTLEHIIERAEAIEGPARRGVARLDELILTSGGHSLLERRFLQLVRRARLPVPVPKSSTVATAVTSLVSTSCSRAELVVEVSGGRGHSSARPTAKDARAATSCSRWGARSSSSPTKT